MPPWRRSPGAAAPRSCTSSAASGKDDTARPHFSHLAGEEGVVLIGVARGEGHRLPLHPGEAAGIPAAVPPLLPRRRLRRRRRRPSSAPSCPSRRRGAAGPRPALRRSRAMAPLAALWMHRTAARRLQATDGAASPPGSALGCRRSEIVLAGRPASRATAGGASGPARRPSPGRHTWPASGSRRAPCRRTRGRGPGSGADSLALVGEPLRAVLISAASRPCIDPTVVRPAAGPGGWPSQPARGRSWRATHAGPTGRRDRRAVARSRGLRWRAAAAARKRWPHARGLPTAHRPSAHRRAGRCRRKWERVRAERAWPAALRL